jgi:hypothetical protein
VDADWFMSLAPVGRLGSSLDPMICPACSANPLRLLRLSGRQRRAEEQEGEEDDVPTVLPRMLMSFFPTGTPG